MTDGDSNASGKSLSVQCCVVGGGPAGMMLGYLLGRAGIKTLVLEKHADSSAIFEVTPYIHRR